MGTLKTVVATVFAIFGLSERSILETVRAGKAVDGGRNTVRTPGDFAMSAEVEFSQR